jgi:hypothetical protein
VKAKLILEGWSQVMIIDPITPIIKIPRPPMPRPLAISGEGLEACCEEFEELVFVLVNNPCKDGFAVYKYEGDL